MSTTPSGTTQQASEAHAEIGLDAGWASVPFVVESGHGASMHMAASSRARSLVAKVSLECACLGQVSTVRPRVFFGASVVWQLFPSCGTWQVYLQVMAL